MPIKKIILFPILVFSFFICKSSVNDTLIQRGSMWKYLDDGSDQGTSWILPLFNDSSWSSGYAELGYGDGDEATVISYGPSSSNKYITTYFRKTFYVANAFAYRGLRLHLKRDDGAVVYLNGAEVYRSNLPNDTINYLSLSPYAIAGSTEASFIPASIDIHALISGTNTIAVEIHQDDPASADLSFDMDLIGDSDVEIMRGPYLQLPTDTTMEICYRTSGVELSKILYGLTPIYTDSVIDNTFTKDHAVLLHGLIPGTKYYYAVCSADRIISGDSSNYFFTAPDIGSRQPVRIWTMGDFGNGSVFQQLTRDAYYSYSNNQYTNLILFLGDNAYPLARDEDYTMNVFSDYETILKSSAVYSTCGNHELFSANSVNQSGVYYDIFHLPSHGENGGVPSGTEAYYSFNYSNVHFICLESNIDSFGTVNLNNMISWLYSDLTNNTQPWIITYFHEPPYSKGYHDSDTDSEMIYMRENIIPILEAYNVDLVLSGHSHSYERSHLLKGFYGPSSSLLPGMIVDSLGGGFPNYYSKSSPSDSGTVYAVVASSSEIIPGQPDWPHPAMYYSTDSLHGSMMIDVNGDSLIAKFITTDTLIADQFTIVKSISTGIKNTIGSNFDFIIYPSIAKNEININLINLKNEPVSIVIFNSLGQVIKFFQDVRNKSSLHVNVNDMKEGTYYVRINGSTYSGVKRFIKYQ